ncbi:uncharacterized protein ColSpa_01694 [Colletotrichum spaethianum]|uniref:Uncharacterized protein n=1 Tax=Colletotrichum spaethianum TaxID=700344 RepID=A0AA37NYU5_9PEZI|nr:uncharacterized protein ColSpa_01694 [Colletotrichum spaethianum]GKT41513.1 hypothetical protein ColSpa_01694 [Colletotrichum spaethianum]
MRGAQHHTPFARWLVTCVEEVLIEEEADLIRQAINARFIVNNDLSRITADTNGDTLPEIFWWPQWPNRDILRELAWRLPDLKHEVALACIVANYQDVFDELRVWHSHWQAEVA